MPVDAAVLDVVTADDEEEEGPLVVEGGTVAVVVTAVDGVDGGSVRGGTAVLAVLPVVSGRSVPAGSVGPVWIELAGVLGGPAIVVEPAEVAGATVATPAWGLPSEVAEMFDSSAPVWTA